MNWRSSRSPVLIAGEGQPPSTMTSGNHDPYLCMQELIKSCSCRGVVGSADAHVQSTATRRQGRRLLGPAALRACPFASLLSQARACLGPGGYCRRFGNGGPQTCLPAACGMAQVGAQRGPSSSTQAQDPREGPSLMGGRQEASSRAASSGRLARRRRDQCKGTSRGSHYTSHDDQGQAGARRAPACAGSLFPLWCKGGKHRPRHRAKVTISVQQDQDQQNGRTEVIVEPKTASSSGPLAVEDQL